LVDELKRAVPESDDLVAEHLADNGELLLHLLMSDLLRMTVSTFHEGRPAVAARLLTFVDRCLREGDDDLPTPSASRSLKTSALTRGEPEALLNRWPPALRAELGR
jgi:hypothetical protein